MGTTEIKICSRCIYDSLNVPGIFFDKQGVCNYCHQIDAMRIEYGTGTESGYKRLNQIIEEIKANGNRKRYDCVVGVSGGTDSSFLLAKAVEWGLRPLAVHYDNTWNTAAATENIRKVTSKLNVDLYTHVVANEEIDDIFRAFFFAGVIEIDCSTDMALSETMYRAASLHGIKYVLEGHSFLAEGISPITRGYQDGGYVSDVHKKFGKLKMRTYPLMSFSQFMKWVCIYRIKKIRPLWYIKYAKRDAQEYLVKHFGWKDYSGHHLENRMSAFAHTVYRPQKFNNDQRNNSLSAAVRAGIISREEALRLYNSPPEVPDGLIEYFQKRLNLTLDQYEQIMKGPVRTFSDFRTYKNRFERLQPFFFMLAKYNLVPMSFYLKYCFPIRTDR